MKRSRLRSFVLFVCAIQLFAGARTNWADDHAAAEKLLPKETLAFFSIADIPELNQKWAKTTGGQLFQEPQLKPFLDDLTKKCEEISKSVEDEIGVTVNELLALPQGEFTAALLEKPERQLALVLMLEYGDNQETVDKLLKKMDEALEKSEAEHSVEEIDEVKVHVYTLKNEDEDFPVKTLVYFVDESYLVFSNELEAVKAVLERWEGNSDDSLADNEQFKYVLAQCKPENSEPQVKLFVSPSGLIQTGIAMAQSSIPQIGVAAGFLPMLGVDGLKGYGGTMTFDEGEYEAIGTFFVYADNPKGLMGIFNFPAAQLAPPKWVPASVGSYALMNWNVLGAYSAIEGLVDTFQGRGATARFLDGVADQGPMIHPKKDVIDHLDGKIHFLQGTPKPSEDGAPIPQILLAMGLKDAAKMKKTLSVATKASGAPIETREFNGETVYEVEQPGSDQKVSFAVTEGQLVVTNDTATLEGMMRGQSGRAAALVDSPDYKRHAKLFPSKLSMLSFQRTDVQIKMYYDMLKSADPEQIGGLDASKLPPFEVIAKYLLPNASYLVPDKKGAKSVSFTLKP